MKHVIIYSLLILSQSVLAGKKTSEHSHDKKTHRHVKSHVHGSAELSIAFEKQNGKIEFKAASDGVLGFEHAAKSQKEKDILSKAIATFEKEISTFVQLEESLGCTITPNKVGIDNGDSNEGSIHHKAEHSDFVATYSVACKSEILGSKLVLDFSSVKGLKAIESTILVGDLQKSVKLKSKPQTIELK
jgi:hypothetical protein